MMVMFSIRSLRRMYAFIKSHRGMHVRSLHLAVGKFYRFYFYLDEARGGAESGIRKEVRGGCSLDSRCCGVVLMPSSLGGALALSTNPTLSQ